ncbi:hypothetical protein M434DRAFT_28557 [Hypoxylon sp. CO27-5]|nr:hypothetical protein M434DRAFT_28557 [Hypoxylon sp. CO27-5]
MAVLFATLGINPVLVSSDDDLFGSKYNEILSVLKNIMMQQFLREQPILCHNYQTGALSEFLQNQSNVPPLPQVSTTSIDTPSIFVQSLFENVLNNLTLYICLYKGMNNCTPD